MDVIHFAVSSSFCNEQNIFKSFAYSVWFASLRCNAMWLIASSLTFFSESMAILNKNDDEIDMQMKVKFQNSIVTARGVQLLEMRERLSQIIMRIVFRMAHFPLNLCRQKLMGVKDAKQSHHSHKYSGFIRCCQRRNH